MLIKFAVLWWDILKFQVSKKSWFGNVLQFEEAIFAKASKNETWRLLQGNGIHMRREWL